MAALPDKVLEAFHKRGDAAGAAESEREMRGAGDSAGGAGAREWGVVIDAGKRVAVPDFHGNDLRTVVERAGGLSLRVRTLGSGLAQGQAPAAGTMVPLGTEIVVRFAR